MEPIVKNTAYVSNILNTYRSEVDKNPERYNILGSSKNVNIATSKDKYSKDPNAYYPYVDPQKDKTPYAGPTNMRIEKNGDHEPYYNPTGVYHVIQTPRIGKEIPIIMGDTQVTFPTETNVQKLHNQLEAIKLRQSFDLGTADSRGIYVKDPSPYYDPTREAEDETVKDIESNIVSMKENIEEGKKVTLVANIETKSYSPQVENSFNYNQELKMKKVKENYYTQIVRKDGRDVELANEVSQEQRRPPKEPLNTGIKIDVEEITHKLEDADGNTTGTGDVYYSPKTGSRKNKISKKNDSKSSKNLRANTKAKDEVKMKMIAPNVFITNKKTEVKDLNKKK